MPKTTEYAQGTPNWVDLQTTDQSAAKQFYSSLFGWSYDDQPMPDGGAVYCDGDGERRNRGGDRADAARCTGGHAADVEHLPRGR